jgi:hypothetical protein
MPAKAGIQSEARTSLTLLTDFLSRGARRE